jgi:hypothetical protein
VARYRKKPVVIEAVQWLPETQPMLPVDLWPDAVGKGTIERVDDCLRIKTLEGVMTATPGWWIIRGVQGEFYPCKPDIFEATYEAI